MEHIRLAREGREEMITATLQVIFPPKDGESGMVSAKDPKAVKALFSGMKASRRKKAKP